MSGNYTLECICWKIKVDGHGQQFRLPGGEGWRKVEEGLGEINGDRKRLDLGCCPDNTEH